MAYRHSAVKVELHNSLSDAFGDVLEVHRVSLDEAADADDSVNLFFLDHTASGVWKFVCSRAGVNDDVLGGRNSQVAGEMRVKGDRRTSTATFNFLSSSTAPFTMESMISVFHLVWQIPMRHED